MMVGRREKFAPTNQEYWEDQYDGEEDVQEAAEDVAAVVDAMDPDYLEDVLGEDYGVENLYDAPESAWEAFGAIFGQDADEILEEDDSWDGMNMPENMKEASESGEYQPIDPMEDQSTNAITRR